MKILRICAAGMCTSMLMRNMNELAGGSASVHVLPAARLEEAIDDYDVILVGPQVRFKFESISKLVESRGKVAGLINPLDYGRLNAEAVLRQAKELFEKKGGKPR